MYEIWSGVHDRFLRPAPAVWLPDAPRTIADETLTSYCMRLADHCGVPLTEMTSWLGIPSHVPLRLLEALDRPELVDRLCAVTRRPRARFQQLQVSQLHDLLPVAHRQAYCRACWDERARRGKMNAAYLSWRWGSSWSLICTRHAHLGLMRERSVSDARPWPLFFRHRAEWGELPSINPPVWWARVCDELSIEHRDWPTFFSWVWRMQRCANQAFESGIAGAELRTVADLTNYWQAQWHSSHYPSRFGSGLRSPESDLCSARGLVGSIAVRCQALLVTYRILRHLVSPDGNLPNCVKERVCKQQRSWAEVDWLQLRLQQWPQRLKVSAIELFDLVGYGPNYPISPRCWECTFDNDTPAIRVNRKRKPLGEWSCIYDPWSLGE